MSDGRHCRVPPILYWFVILGQVLLYFYCCSRIAKCSASIHKIHRKPWSVPICSRLFSLALFFCFLLKRWIERFSYFRIVVSVRITVSLLRITAISGLETHPAFGRYSCAILSSSCSGSTASFTAHPTSSTIKAASAVWLTTGISEAPTASSVALLTFPFANSSATPSAPAAVPTPGDGPAPRFATTPTTAADSFLFYR